ncbi:MAG: hypothetical protein ABIV06_11215, partial [Thermoanaerobaculia bacterium]
MKRTLAMLLLGAISQTSLAALPEPGEVALVRDINPSQVSDLGAESVVRMEETLTDWVPFWVNETSMAPGLWATDGTESGTVPVTGLVQNGYYNQDFGICFSGRTWYFWNSDAGGLALWRSDGTSPGTVVLARWSMEYSFLAPFWFEPRACESRSVDGRILFWLERPVTGGYEAELWSTDGAPAGARMVKDLGVDPYYHNALQAFARLGDRLIFSLQLANADYGIWATDGTTEGTSKVVASVPDEPNLWPSYMLAVGPRVYFRTFYTATGPHFGYTDGTPAGTRVFPDLAVEPYMLVAPGYANLAGRVVFPAVDLDAAAIWTIDANEEVPAALMTFPGGSYVSPFSWTGEFTVGGKAIFWATVPVPPGAGAKYETRLVATGGTSATTTEIGIFCAAGEASCAVRSVGRASDSLLFLSATASGCALWRTDGTST